MSPTTVYLARFLGVFCVLLCAVMASRPKASLAAIGSLMANPGLLFVTGIATLASGAALVVGQSIWSGGALAVVVTLLGWVTLLKGLALIAIPPRLLNGFYRALYTPERFRLAMGTALILSLWLMIAGFRV